MNEPTKTNEPCPFCGPKGHVYEQDVVSIIQEGRHRHAGCYRCGCFVDKATWNTRTLPAEVVKVLRELRELLSDETGWLRNVFPSSYIEGKWCKAAVNTITRIDAILKEADEMKERGEK